MKKEMEQASEMSCFYKTLDNVEIPPKYLVSTSQSYSDLYF